MGSHQFNPGSSPMVKAKSWSVKSVMGKVICEWDVDIKQNETVKSPKFWHSGSTEWCMKVSREGALDFYLTFQLLTMQRGMTVEADLKVSVKWDGATVGVQENKIVTLTAPQDVFLLSGVFLPIHKFCICCEVSIRPGTPDPHRVAALEMDLYDLSNDLGALLDSGDLTDVVLCVGGTELKAHRALLSARSDVFANLLCENNFEAEVGRINIEDVGPDTMREMLRYIYTGRAPHLEEMAEDLLTAADKYGLPGLKDLCGHELARKLTVHNAATTGILAMRYSCDTLMQFVVSFIKKNLVSVLGTDGWAAAVRKHTELVAQMSRMIAEQSEK